MRISITSFFGLILICFAFNVGAQLSASKWYFDCNAKHAEDTVENIMKGAVWEAQCIGYTSGLIDGFRFYGDKYPQNRIACLPSQGVEDDYIIKQISKFIERHPESSDMPARIVIIRVLMETFPCK